jgi:hypothetical protein
VTDAHEVLIDHHRALRTMMRRFDELLSAPVQDRRQLLNTLSAEMQIHEQIEDELYYPAVRDLTPLVWLAHAEHRQLEDQLAVVLRTPLDGEPFPDEWRILVRTLEGHATEEETDMFPEAGAYLDAGQLHALGHALQTRQAQLRRSRLVQARHWLKRETLRRL